MPNSYLRYIPEKTWGIISTGQIISHRSGKLIATAGLEKVLIWNVITGEKVKN